MIDFNKNFASISGLCRVDEWDEKVLEWKSMLGDDAVITNHGKNGDEWIMFTARRADKK